MAQTQKDCMRDGGWPADPNGLGDEDDVLPYEKPLDLGLAIDGTDDLHDLEDGETAQDGAGDALDDSESDDVDHGERHRHNAPQAEAGQAWQIVMAERDDAGNWHTVGEPLPDVDFIEQALAYDCAERENKRRFGSGFDWANDPGRAWVAVRAGTRGSL